MSYIYYTSGRTQLQSCRLRVYVLCIAHTHCVSLALCVLIISTLSVALDRRIIEGAILTSVSRPCAWLPLSLSSDGVTPALTVASYAASYVFLPLTHVFLCGRIPIQPIKTLIVNAVTVIVPFALGTLSQKTDIANTGTVLSALCVLYVECCKLLREAEGTLYIVDVIATLFLVVSWLAAVAISCYIYEICGLLTAVERNSLLLVATSKSTNIDYLSGCSAVGLARLPAVFSAPTQALLLSAIFVWPQNGLPHGMTSIDFFQCGRIPIQPIKTLIVNTVTVIVPFALGTLSQKTDIANTGTVLSALCVLYVECCKLLREAEGTLYIVDVIATLFLVVSWLAAVAISCYIYEICGLLTAVERNSLLLVATSKSTNIDYLSGCSAVGLARLPAVFSAPTQALLLSAIFVWPQNGLPR
ncbi:hypothetical protein KGM_200467 [Danaus plexippus plexippus]|uniref:Uncharacterized protein n=1 Tax=Danaus plexippus plexippus TaxID=278856 RepID=A0A212FD37_DANPL|nr:hypothetical protein KGM_200467 [Danaus plexippus plexippus]